jgi:signal transduction histidine kinase
VAVVGPGVDPAHQDQIWWVFVRLAGRDVVEGTGLGLALVRMIVRGWGGYARVVSVPGEGATFEFSIPQTVEAGDGGRTTPPDRGQHISMISQ